jgi:hypothetical protein
LNPNLKVGKNRTIKSGYYNLKRQNLNMTKKLIMEKEKNLFEKAKKMSSKGERKRMKPKVFTFQSGFVFHCRFL